MDQRIRQLFNLNVPTYGSPTIAGDLVTVMTADAANAPRHTTLHAIDLAAGSESWKLSLKSALVSDPVAAVDETLLLGLQSTDRLQGFGMLLALDRATGRERWRWASGARWFSAPLVVDGVVYFTIEGNTLYALDLESGHESWRLALPAPRSVHTPAVAGDLLLLPSRGPHVMAISRADAAVRWTFTHPRDSNVWLLTTPCVAGEKVFATASSGALFALDLHTGVSIWRVFPGSPGKALSAPRTDGDRVFVGSADHSLYAVQADSGKTVWSFPTSHRIVARPLIRRGVVYMAGHDHRLRALDAATGFEYAVAKANARIEGQPAIVEGAGPIDHRFVLAVDRTGQAVSMPVVESHERARQALQAEDYGRAVELYKEAGEWLAAGRLLRDRLYDFAAAADALLSAARDVDTDADLWAEAEEICRMSGDSCADLCHRRVVELRNLPDIQLEVTVPDRMVLNQYAELVFRLHNVGVAPAFRVSLLHSESDFAGDVRRSQAFPALSPGSEITQVLSVKPLALGERVPLDITVEFEDAEAQVYHVDKRAIVQVADVPEVDRRKSHEMRMEDVRDFADLEVHIGDLQGERYPVRVLHSPAGDAEGWFCAPFTDDQLDDILVKLTRGPIDNTYLSDIGAQMFAALFDADVRARYAASIEAAQNRKGLRLRLRIDPAELASLPWELLFDPERRRFLSLSKRIAITRYLPVARRIALEPMDWPLEVLMACASPTDLPAIDVEAERQAVHKALAPLVKAGYARLTVLKHATAVSIREQLLDSHCHILHIAAHGEFEGGKGYLLLEDDRGHYHRLSGNEISILIADTGVRLAVLNVCESA